MAGKDNELASQKNKVEESIFELFEQILLNGTNENHRYCRYCKAKMILPIELHRDDCLWRRAWKLVNDHKGK